MRLDLLLQDFQRGVINRQMVAPQQQQPSPPVLHTNTAQQRRLAHVQPVLPPLGTRTQLPGHIAPRLLRAAPPPGARPPVPPAPRPPPEPPRPHPPPPPPARLLPPPPPRPAAKPPAPAPAALPRPRPCAECRAAQSPLQAPAESLQAAPGCQSSAAAAAGTDPLRPPSSAGTESLPARAPADKCPVRWPLLPVPRSRCARSRPAKDPPATTSRA